MRSTIAWLDSSDAQRRQMMEVVSLFRERNTVDDIGIGSVRDTLSDLLFPGTSTLHTRAKYLLFIPWLCLQMEAEGTPARRGWDRLKELEITLIHALLAGGETEGVIGRNARENLQQFPSFMYWGALGRHGLRVAPFNRGQYVASLDGFHQARRVARYTDDGDPLDGVPHTWHSEIPAADDDFLHEATFDLTGEQASYLTDRVLGSAPGSYLAHLVQSPPSEDVDFPWHHPALPTAAPGTAEMVSHARRFSELIHGAALLYNLLLAEAVRTARTAGGTVAVDEDLVDTYRSQLDDWADHVRDRATDYAHTWDRVHFWQVVTDANPRVPHHTRRFIKRWLTLATTREPHRLVDDPEARELIRRREFETKGKLARLRNPRALERWQGASSSSQLAFRWPQVQTIATEIVRGREAAHA